MGAHFEALHEGVLLHSLIPTGTVRLDSILSLFKCVEEDEYLAGGECLAHVCLSRDGVDDRPEDVGRFDELLQNVGLRREGEPVVQHLVQQLVDHHIVVLDDTPGFSLPTFAKVQLLLQKKGSSRLAQHTSPYINRWAMQRR